MPEQVYEEVIDAFEALFGKHPGFRRAHAKGVVCEGTFSPASTAVDFCRAPHLQGPPLPVTLRFSNFAGLPELPDNDPQSNPRGMSIRFQAPGGATTDIVAHSYNGFPTSTVEELTAFLRALAASGPTTPDPKPIAKFLESHPAAARFAQAPKPAPASFATESFYGVNAFRFTNRAGKEQFGRSQIHPVGQEHHLSAAEAASRSPNYLFEELAARLKSGSARFRLVVQVAASGDPITDASQTWPDTRPRIELGTLEVHKIAENSDALQCSLIFDPMRLIDGIEPSDDPVLKARPGAYSVSYRRRTGSS
jgi:catalase